MPEKPKMVRTLQTIRVCRDYKEATANLQREHAAPTHFDGTPIDRDTVVLAPDGTTIIALLLTDRVDLRLCEQAFEIAETVDDLLDKRPTAGGTKGMVRVKKNGRLGKFHVAPAPVMEIHNRDDVREGLLGAIAGTGARSPRKSRLTDERPAFLDELRSLVERVDDLHAKYVPNLHAYQRAEVKKAPEFRLWHTAYSSLYIVRHLRAAYHRDRHNLRGALSALLPLGTFTGGELVLPRWRVAFAFKPGDVLFFNPQELHGNLPIEGDRSSLVCYCARGLSMSD